MSRSTISVTRTNKKTNNNNNNNNNNGLHIRHSEQIVFMSGIAPKQKRQNNGFIAKRTCDSSSVERHLQNQRTIGPENAHLKPDLGV